MIDRYSTKEMRQVWSLDNKLQKWLDVEILALEAFAIKKVIPKASVLKIKKNVKINSKLMEKIEKNTKHDVVAFTRMLSQSLGKEKKWIHYKLTSTDVVDTAQGKIFQEANNLIYQKLKELAKTLKKKAKQYSKTLCVGRTHGIHAEITSFGLKYALWFDEMQRNIKRFDEARKDVEQGKLSGAVGNHANVKSYVQDYVCKKLKIKSAKISTQVLQRDNHANYFSTLAIIASTLEKIAIEIRHLQRSEVAEVFEYFDKKQKGSSAMPHKKNPIGSENITGQARLMRGYAMAAMENNSLWHERDISHSSVERVIAPSATATLEYSLIRINNILEKLIVNKKQMQKNIDLTNGVIYSQRVLNYLIETKKCSREIAYDLIQPLALISYEKNQSFKKLLIDKKILSKDQSIKLFDPSYYLKEVETIFKRVKII